MNIVERRQLELRLDNLMHILDLDSRIEAAEELLRHHYAYPERMVLLAEEYIRDTGK